MGGKLPSNRLDNIGVDAADIGVLAYRMLHNRFPHQRERRTDANPVHLPDKLQIGGAARRVQHGFSGFPVNDYIMGHRRSVRQFLLNVVYPRRRRRQKLAVVRMRFVVDDKMRGIRIGSISPFDACRIMREREELGIVGPVLENPAHHAAAKRPVGSGLHGNPRDAIVSRGHASSAQNGIEYHHLGPTALHGLHRSFRNTLEALTRRSRIRPHPEHVLCTLEIGIGHERTGLGECTHPCGAASSRPVRVVVQRSECTCKASGKRRAPVTAPAEPNVLI